jgi:flavodoxin
MAEDSAGGRTVLVTVASKHGATKEIAGLTGGTIAAAGFAVTVMPPGRVEIAGQAAKDFLSTATTTRRCL